MYPVYFILYFLLQNILLIDLSSDRSYYKRTFQTRIQRSKYYRSNDKASRKQNNFSSVIQRPYFKFFYVFVHISFTPSFNFKSPIVLDLKLLFSKCVVVGKSFSYHTGSTLLRFQAQ